MSTQTSFPRRTFISALAYPAIVCSYAKKSTTKQQVGPTAQLRRVQSWVGRLAHRMSLNLMASISVSRQLGTDI